MRRCLHVPILTDLAYLLITYLRKFVGPVRCYFYQHTVLWKEVWVLTAPVHIGHATLVRLLEQATRLSFVATEQPTQTSVLFTRCRVLFINQFVSCGTRVYSIDKQKQCLLHAWHCLNHRVSDDAAIHILVHVFGQMWTLERFYLATRHKCFTFVTHYMTFKLYLP